MHFCGLPDKGSASKRKYLDYRYVKRHRTRLRSTKIVTLLTIFGREGCGKGPQYMAVPVCKRAKAQGMKLRGLCHV